MASKPRAEGRLLNFGGASLYVLRCRAARSAHRTLVCRSTDGRFVQLRNVAWIELFGNYRRVASTENST